MDALRLAHLGDEVISSMAQIQFETIVMVAIWMGDLGTYGVMALIEARPARVSWVLLSGPKQTRSTFFWALIQFGENCMQKVIMARMHERMHRPCQRGGSHSLSHSKMEFGRTT